MTLVIFIIILGILVLVHEMGHFILAKRAGVRVDEFGFGYPPKAVSLGKKWGTEFSLNWIPFGGFVKIFGENYDGEGDNSLGKKFTDISKKWQAAILVAGVFFNFLFAWILFSVGFVIGVPAPVENNLGGEVKDAALTVISVLPDSPASEASLKSGDRLVGFSSPEEFSDRIAEASGEIGILVERSGEQINLQILPKEGIIVEEPTRKAIGINMDMVGILQLPIHKAVVEGGRTAVDITYLTAKGLGSLIINSFRGQADLSQVTGPVGIVGLVGDASRLGFSYLLTFTALISINLAVINLIPFPALDGGRLLFVGIEAVKRSPVNPRVAQSLNLVGFGLLIALMLVITFRDIMNLF